MPMTPVPSPPWCLRLISELNAADERAIALTKGLAPGQLNWKPRPDQWSIGQCLEHLDVANRVYLPAIANSLGGRPSAVVEQITPGWFGRWFIRRYIDPSSVTRRVRAPKTIAPSAQVDPSVLDRFLGSNHEARDLVQRASHHDVNRIRFRNPFIPMLRRHLLQAERIKASRDFPGP
jgi:hypothetical protein